MHGGSLGGYDKKVWTAEEKAGALTLCYMSPAGEGGYPGDLKMTVTYALSEKNEVVVSYEAEANGDTICNPSHHTYFNLEGFCSGSVLDQKIRIFAEKYTPTDNELIPDGRVLLVEGTPLDFREMKEIGARIDAPFSQMRWAGGYDHNFVLDRTPAEEEAKELGLGEDAACPVDYTKLHKLAHVYAEKTGVYMRAYTTQPGVQFYSGNHLDGVLSGKAGAAFAPRAGFTLEAQVFPDAVHHANFPQSILRPGKEWRAQTVFAFGLA